MPAPELDVMAPAAAVTHSQVSQSAHKVTECEMLSSQSEPDDDSSAEETAPITDFSEFKRHCAVGYENDPAIQNESMLSQYTNRHGLCWAPGDVLVVPIHDT